MIKLRDVRKHAFFLTSQRSSDQNFYSPRKDIRDAILAARGQALLNDYQGVELQIHRKLTALPHYAIAPDITVRILADDTLQLGCHTFSPRNTRLILRWAGIKVPKPVQRTIIDHQHETDDYAIVRHER